MQKTNQEMLQSEWQPDDLRKQMDGLFEAGWALVAYRFSRPSDSAVKFVCAGLNPDPRARAYEAIRRSHNEGLQPVIRYQLIYEPDPPSVENEVCRVSRDGRTLVSVDFTHMAAAAVHLGLNTRAEVQAEEREYCEEVLAIVECNYRDSIGMKC
jgi:hypothetical protein